MDYALLSVVLYPIETYYYYYYISVPLDLKVTCDTRLILNICYVWKLNQTVLELDFWAVKFLFLYIYIIYNGADVVEWSRALDIMLSYWCCSVSMMWVQISYTLLCVCMYAMACILLTNYTELLILKNALHFFSTVGKHFSDMTFKMAIYYFLKQRYVHNAHKHTLW